MRKYLKEAPEAVDPSDYTNTDFKPYVVGNSNPLADKINPALLKDIDLAAQRANVKVSVTTAVSGHRKGSRHETGHAVDIAMINGKGYSSESDANQKGILDDIQRFVSELQSMGYVKNSESGNDKAVLTFGFPQHHHHVHVSRKSDESGDDNYEKKPDSDEKKSETDKEKEDDKVEDVVNTLTKGKSIGFDRKDFIDSIARIMGGLQKESKEVKPIIEEINRFKQLIK